MSLSKRMVFFSIIRCSNSYYRLQWTKSAAEQTFGRKIVEPMVTLKLYLFILLKASCIYTSLKNSIWKRSVLKLTSGSLLSSPLRTSSSNSEVSSS